MSDKPMTNREAVNLLGNAAVRLRRQLVGSAPADLKLTHLAREIRSYAWPEEYPTEERTS